MNKKIKLISKPTGNSYEIEVWCGIYSGKERKIMISRDCYNAITIYSYDVAGENIGRHFKFFEIFSPKIAKKLGKSLIELSMRKYRLKEPI